jgi:bacterioferritin (cytochrome b1)
MPLAPSRARRGCRCKTTIGDQDPTTHRMLEAILANEEEHAEDLSSLLEGMKDQERG